MRNKQMTRKPKIAYIFPGQGSQAIGMGSALYTTYPSAKKVFDEADGILGFALSRLCFDGPEEVLTETINVQPAVLTVSIACLKAAQEVSSDCMPLPDIVAGHSLGEYTALVAAGSLRFSEALQLVRERGRLMNEAAQSRRGGMIAVIGLEENDIVGICQSTGTEISNINSPGQIVVSGAEENLAEFKKRAEIQGARRIIPLKVSGAFHSQLMHPAIEGLQTAIVGCTFRELSVPIIANVTGQMLSDARSIKEELANQLINCIQWQRIIENMIADGVTRFFEIGHGRVLAGLIRRINAEVEICNVSDVGLNEVVKDWRHEQNSSSIPKTTASQRIL